MAPHSISRKWQFYDFRLLSFALYCAYRHAKIGPSSSSFLCTGSLDRHREAPERVLNKYYSRFCFELTSRLNFALAIFLLLLLYILQPNCTITLILIVILQRFITLFCFTLYILLLLLLLHILSYVSLVFGKGGWMGKVAQIHTVEKFVQQVASTQ